MILEQSITCPWCKTYYAVLPNYANCRNCGGPLPKPISKNRGEKPDPAPRFLPTKFKNQLLYWKNTFSLVGIIFMIVGTPLILAFGFGLIFVIIGYFLYKKGKTTANETIQALEHGSCTEGIIEDIRLDYSQNINGRNPFIISYSFLAGNTKQIDNIVCWDEQNQLRTISDEIWVVYMPENPSISSPWPPII